MRISRKAENLVVRYKNAIEENVYTSLQWKRGDDASLRTEVRIMEESAKNQLIKFITKLENTIREQKKALVTFERSVAFTGEEGWGNES